MAHEIVVDFNALPRSVRERIIDSTGPSPRLPPLLESRGVPRVPIIRWFLFAIFPMVPCLAGPWLSGDMAPTAGSASVPLGLIFGWWALLFFLTALGFRLAYSHLQRKVLPFEPGLYLFPTHIVDATSQRLRITPLDDLTGIELRHFSVNGTYDATSCLFSFREGARQNIIVRGKAAAEAGVREFERVRAVHAQAMQQQDVETLRQYNLFFDVRGNGLEALQHQAPEAAGMGPLATDLPGFMHKRWLLAFAISIPLSPSVLLLRMYGDNVAFQKARAAGTASAYFVYTEKGWRHLDEARELGAQANFKECDKEDTETCWRVFLYRWSDSPLRQQVRTERMPRAALREASGTPP